MSNPKWWMAARRFAKTLNDEQRPLFLALMAEHDRAVLTDMAVNEAKLWSRFSDTSAGDALILGEVDYALGRTTSVPYIAVEHVLDQWEGLEDDLKDAIATRIRTAIDGNRAGEGDHVAEWTRVLARHAAERDRAPPAGP